MKKAWHQQTRKAPKEARTDIDGTIFDSKGELHRWKKLQRWQLSGEIRNLRRQVSYPLVLADGTPILTPTGKTAHYTADFVYERHHIEKMPPPPQPPDEAPEELKVQWAQKVACPALIDHGWPEVIEDYKGFIGRLEAFRIAVFEAIYNKKVTLTGPRKRQKGK